MVTEDFFRDRLRFLRNEKKVSAREMSLALGQNESYINKIETGRTSTTISSFLNICEYLNISPTDFFNEKVNNTSDIEEIQSLLKNLSTRQVSYITELIRDLSKSSQENDSK